MSSMPVFPTAQMLEGHRLTCGMSHVKPAIATVGEIPPTPYYRGLSGWTRGRDTPCSTTHGQGCVSDCKLLTRRVAETCPTQPPACSRLYRVRI